MTRPRFLRICKAGTPCARLALEYRIAIVRAQTVLERRGKRQHLRFAIQQKSEAALRRMRDIVRIAQADRSGPVEPIERALVGRLYLQLAGADRIILHGFCKVMIRAARTDMRFCHQ